MFFYFGTKSETSIFELLLIRIFTWKLGILVGFIASSQGAGRIIAYHVILCQSYPTTVVILSGGRRRNIESSISLPLEKMTHLDALFLLK